MRRHFLLAENAKPYCMYILYSATTYIPHVCPCIPPLYLLYTFVYPCIPLRGGQKTRFLSSAPPPHPRGLPNESAWRMDNLFSGKWMKLRRLWLQLPMHVLMQVEGPTTSLLYIIMQVLPSHYYQYQIEKLLPRAQRQILWGTPSNIEEQ